MLRKHSLPVFLIRSSGAVSVNRNSGGIHADPKQFLKIRRGCLLHKRRMKSAAHSKFFGSSACFRRKFTELLQMFRSTRNHELSGAIVIDRIHIRETGAKLLYRFIFELQNGCHSTRMLLRGLLHQFTSAADKGKAVLLRKGAGKSQSGHFSKRKSGSHIRVNTSFLKCICCGEVNRKHTRLRVGRLRQLCGISLETLTRCSRTDGIRQLKQACGLRADFRE